MRQTARQFVTARIRSEIDGLARFGIVGVIATIVYYVAGQGFATADFEPIRANLFAYLAGTSISFLGHFTYTFRKRDQILRHLTRFIVVSAGGYLLSHATIWLGAYLIGLPFWIASMIVVVVVASSSWAANRFWAFA